MRNEHVVEVVRDGIVESRHRVHVAVVDAEGRLRASVGDPEMVTFVRSAAKPLQALPLVADGAMDRFGLSDEELALACGSHSGEDRHLAVARSILGKIGLDGEALACGAHPPFNEGARRELTESGLEPLRLHNNCSGKHAGMMALARVHGWNPAGYQRLEHPVQARVLAEVAAWVEVTEDGIPLGTDGCGVVCFALPLWRMGMAFARLGRAARRGEPAPQRVVQAMTAYPGMVAGEGRLCTELMTQTEGRVFGKVGAEGFYCVGIPGAELGIALKIEDGASRALGPAVLSVLRQLDLISEDDLGALSRHAYPQLRNTCGDVVGGIRPHFSLGTPDA